MNSQTHMKIPYIQAGGDCLGTGWGCDKCYNADGSCACADGTQPWDVELVKNQCVKVLMKSI